MDDVDPFKTLFTTDVQSCKPDATERVEFVFDVNILKKMLIGLSAKDLIGDYSLIIVIIFICTATEKQR